MKRILSVLLSVVMLMGMMSAIPAVAVETSTVGYSQAVAESGRTKVPNDALNLNDASVVVSSFATDHGTKTAFTVSDLAGLERLKEIVNAGNALAGVTIYQTADIIPSEQTTFDGIGVLDNANKAFSGTYDGQGYTIGNLKSTTNSLLFCTIKTYIDTNTDTTVVIRNVVLKDCILQPAKNKDGFIVGGTIDGNTDHPYTGELIIANCKIESSCEATYTKSITGGIVGHATQDTYVSNCTNNAEMSFTGRCGGIVGRAANPQGVVAITDCVFGGAMTSNQTTEAGASPILGQASTTAIIVGCKTTGTITVPTGKKGYIGAVIGQINDAKANNTVIYNNTDTENTGCELVGNVAKDVTVTTLTAPSAMKLVGIQKGTVENSKMPLRFLAAVNDVDTYASLRYRVSVSGDKSAVYDPQDTTKIYNSVLAKYGTELVTLEHADITNNNVQGAECKGLSALVIKGIPTSGVYRINVTVYGVDSNGTEVWGHTATVTVENGNLTVINGEAVQTQQ